MPIKIFFTKFINGTGIVFSLARDIIIILIVGFLIHFYLYSVYPVRGESMSPIFTSVNLVGVNKLTKNNHLTRGQIVILKFPADVDSEILVKRIIGLPGEIISLNKDGVRINGDLLDEPYLQQDIDINLFNNSSISKELGYDEYFVMGDNRLNSSDSRTFGPIQLKDIIGKANFIFWPIEQFGIITNPIY